MKINSLSNIGFNGDIKNRNYTQNLNIVTSNSSKTNLDSYVKSIDKNMNYKNYTNFKSSLVNKNKELMTIFNQGNNKSDDISNNEKDESQIITKPDGSKVLLLTTSLGGIKATVSIQISKPNEELNGEENKKSNENTKSNHINNNVNINNSKDFSVIDEENDILNNIIRGEN